MIPIKICGITNLEDARFAVNSGASALGFIFYDKSPRYILPETASQIAADLKGQVSFTGVFVNKTLDYIHAVKEEMGLNFIQLHGNETPEYCRAVQLPVIKVFRVAPDFDVETMRSYDVHAFLFDTYEKGKPGGTGDIFNWNLIFDLQTDTPIILSGGLGVENILDAINAVCPSAVDVNSGVESKPGVKDEKKMKALFDILQNTRSSVNPFERQVVKEDSHGL
jgi:phosphoribosylanthranilate isomerase